ncbi:shikimate dehydrogenase [Corynebacterium macginleyi]|uniref:shikimate dehydrogenase n=1 Tax=Corynebacterium macginleyi TaxID=38290 RepID=UPI001909061B|nr:shikimate dehydrogenase [Corynebacterium macginleyi]MBK4157075.1 shikimate dehydrogenase [Corynebacterium macginleyi]MBK4161366.1 shikimate dehydrogenase [Corynebacterium macginleyi]MBK4180693.1 shikimate dehydrogenase [Corynebacterium macginleyi]MBK4182245.1 shikimate dehydrogenase [Corynebacterium macginleyi]
MPRAAVLGSPISHSLSPILHNAGYAAVGLKEWSYTRFEVTADSLVPFLEECGPEYRGFSVTMPGKFAALEVAEEQSERAELIGSANTLVRTPHGWRADNTDTEGMLGALQKLCGLRPLTQVLIIGAGGTSRPALWALAERGVEHVTVLNRSNRQAELQPLAERLGLDLQYATFDDDLGVLSRSADVIISTVPSAALEDYRFQLAHAPVLDVIYHPWPTALAACAAANGYSTVGGHVMLAHQAFSQFEQFTGLRAPREEMVAALQQELRLLNF